MSLAIVSYMVLPSAFNKIMECMDMLLRFFFCKRFYWPLLDFWSLNFKRWIRVFKLLVKPAEERSKGHPNIANRFLGQWLCAAVEPNWLIVIAQPSQIFSEIRCAYFTYITITDIIEPMVLNMTIGEYSVLA